MNPLHSLVRVFVNTFGITQPTPETEARAGRFILMMLIGVAVLIGFIGLVLRSAFVH